MILVFISWCWIGISAFLWGFSGVQLFKKMIGYRRVTPDIVLLSGICFLTVYAQIFSLFYKVGAVASAILLLINGIIIAVHKKELKNLVMQWVNKQNLIPLLILTALAVLILVISSGKMLHYDTQLYHAQSIHWVEDYGVVPGLGNLHNRLAYNSSLFSLQALFSLRFLVGQSLHSINGFVTLTIVGYAICSMKVLKDKKFFVSDFLRLGILIFFGDRNNFYVISSPGSDLLALGLVIYILVKWLSYLEDGEDEIAPYALLCILGVYALTVKLSAAMIILLVISPAVQLIYRRRYKEIVLYIMTGIVILLPFLIRNVIISGYLLYPYPELDLFQVDWKMPEYTLLFDRYEIKTWGWGLNDVYSFNASFETWFPVWLKSLSRGMRYLFFANLLLIIIACAKGLWCGIASKKWDYLLITATITACFLLWFLGAPLPRYGSVFMVLLPLFVIGDIVVSINLRTKKETGTIAIVMMVALCTYFITPLMNYGLNTEWNNRKRCADYEKTECRECVLEEEIIYVPVSGDQAGYYAFPSTPYSNRLSLIELRGNEFSDGFRMKKEYQNAYVSTYGDVYDSNMFESME